MMSFLRCFGVLIVGAIASCGTTAYAGNPRLSAQSHGDAAGVSKPYAQGLVDRMLYRNPQILRLDLIAASPGASEARVIASTLRAAIGEPATQESRSHASAQECQADMGSREYRCLLDMRDTPGAVIGTVLIAMRYYRGEETDHLTAFAKGVRDQLAETTPDLPTLFDPMIIAPKAGDPQAQCAVLDVLSHHPDLMVLAMHVTRPGETLNKIIAINRPRFLGVPSEPVETQLATNGNTLLESFSQTHRLETHVPLLAADNAQVGTLATVYLYHSESEIPRLLRKTLQVQQELKPMIPDVNWLYEPCQLQGGR